MSRDEIKKEVLSFLGWAVFKGYCIDFLEEELEDMAEEYAEERSKWDGDEAK